MQSLMRPHWYCRKFYNHPYHKRDNMCSFNLLLVSTAVPHNVWQSINDLFYSIVACNITKLFQTGIIYIWSKIALTKLFPWDYGNNMATNNLVPYFARWSPTVVLGAATLPKNISIVLKLVFVIRATRYSYAAYKMLIPKYTAAYKVNMIVLKFARSSIPRHAQILLVCWKLEILTRSVVNIAVNEIHIYRVRYHFYMIALQLSDHCDVSSRM